MVRLVGPGGTCHQCRALRPRASLSGENGRSCYRDGSGVWFGSDPADCVYRHGCAEVLMLSGDWMQPLQPHWPPPSFRPRSTCGPRRSKTRRHSRFLTSFVDGKGACIRGTALRWQPHVASVGVLGARLPGVNAVLGNDSFRVRAINSGDAGGGYRRAGFPGRPGRPRRSASLSATPLANKHGFGALLAAASRLSLAIHLRLHAGAKLGAELLILVVCLEDELCPRTLLRDEHYLLSRHNATRLLL